MSYIVWAWGSHWSVFVALAGPLLAAGVPFQLNWMKTGRHIDTIAGPLRRIHMGDDKRIIRGQMEIAGIVGPVWFIGFLFTMGYAQMSFGKVILVLLFWPYYLGSAMG